MVEEADVWYNIYRRFSSTFTAVKQMQTLYMAETAYILLTLNNVEL